MRQNPFDGSDRVFSNFDELWGRFPFGRELLSGESNVSLERDDAGYVVLADIPGFEQSDVDLRYDDGVLTIVGDHEMDEEGGVRSRRRHIHEQVRMPGDVVVEEITATLKNGVLEVHLPLESEPEGGHRIDID